ncbi:MAG TPA: NAD-dependent epimerase/dehydratase family protein [Vicinamibacterales bacterium]|nr:NAD-dependent epimerase/dehydratase family protein [Vicinamibacterales bacterium]
MNVLVTGGTGYLGSALVRGLARAGHHPIVFARRATASGLPGRLIDGDIRDEQVVIAAARGVDAICHAAALVSIWRRRRADFDETNVGGLESAIAACRTHGIPRLIYTSSFLALPPADRDVPLAANDYQRTKVAALAVARRAARAGVPIVALFPGVVYGPGPATEGNLVGRLLRDHLQRRLPGLIGADRPWSFSYVDDVVAAHVAALTRAPAGSEHVIGGANATQMQVFELALRGRGRPLPRRIPFALASALAVVEEARAMATGRPPLLTRGVVEIFRHDWSLDGERSRFALGHPETPLEAGLEATLASLRGPKGRP